VPPDGLKTGGGGLRKSPGRADADFAALARADPGAGLVSRRLRGDVLGPPGRGSVGCASW